MKLKSTPVEPLPEAAWRRIEHRVLEQVAASHASTPESAVEGGWRWRPWPAVVGLSAAMALAAGLWWVTSGVPEPNGASITASNDSSVASEHTPVVNEVPQPVASAEPKTVEERVQATAQPQVLQVGRSRVELARGGVLVIAGERKLSHQVTLEAGRAEFSVQPHPPESPYTVRAGGLEIRVVGTEFDVEVDAKRAAVHVSEGIVAVHDAAQEHLVHAGESYPPVEATPSTQNTPPKGVETKRNRARRGSRPRLSRAERFARAASMERQQPARASRMYRQLARGRDSFASNALYARAVLELDRGNTSLALKLLHDYERRFANAGNRHDVRRLIEQWQPKREQGSAHDATDPAGR